MGNEVHLICGGLKDTQPNDIRFAKEFWRARSRKTSSYRESLLQSLTDPAEAAEYLSAALENSTESFLKALGNVAQARQMTKVAKDSGIQRETLYRSFSSQGNPTFATLSSVLQVLGLKMHFEPLARS